jgi:hypothetical protein
VVATDIEHIVYTSIIDIDVNSPLYYAPIHRETACVRG